MTPEERQKYCKRLISLRKGLLQKKQSYNYDGDKIPDKVRDQMQRKLREYLAKEGK